MRKECSSADRSLSPIALVAGGSAEDGFLAKELSRCGKIVAADRGLEVLRRLSLVPEAAVGDFDSVSQETLSYYSDFPGIRWERHRPEKDETDTELGLRLAMELAEDAAGKEGERPPVYLYAATGTRLDHTLGNIHALKVPFQKGFRAEIRDPHNRIYLAEGEEHFVRQEEEGAKTADVKVYYSFLPLEGPVREVSLEGFKYPLKGAEVLPGRALTVSNELASEEGELRCKGILICFETRD